MTMERGGSWYWPWQQQFWWFRGMQEQSEESDYLLRLWNLLIKKAQAGDYGPDMDSATNRARAFYQFAQSQVDREGLTEDTMLYKTVMDNEAYIVALTTAEGKVATLEQKRISEAETQFADYYKYQSIKRDYIPQLRNTLRASGWKQADIEQEVAKESALIDRGIPVAQLPDYPQVESYTEAKGGYAEALMQRNILIGEAITKRKKQLGDIYAAASKELAPEYQPGLADYGQRYADYKRILDWAQRMQDFQGREAMGQAQLRGMEGRVGAGRAFEQAREQELGMLEEPGDWIEQWLAKYQRNPYPAGYIGGSVPGAVVPTPRGYGRIDPLTAPSWLAEITPGLEPRQAITKGYQAPSPQYPRAPYQLQPGWGERLPEEELPGMAVPSGQWMAQTPWSRIQQARGYAEYAGQDWEGIMRQMQMMLPRTPRGAGRTTWRPARQRISR